MKTMYFKKALGIFAILFSVLLIINCSSDDSSGGGGGGDPTPVIVVAGTFSNFTVTDALTNSDSQSVQVSGPDLLTSITINVTDNFEVSLDDTNFSDQVSISHADAMAGNTEVFVRFSPLAGSLGDVGGSLELVSFEATTITMPLSGTAPDIFNYVAFNMQPLGFGGGFNQSAVQVFDLHTDLSNISQVKMYLQIDCPSTGCDDWDRFANVKVKDPSTGAWFEIGRYITPYWRGTHQLERGLEFDVTDFKSLLVGSVELRIYIENWTAKADLITVDFDYIEGTPDYSNYAVSEVLGYHVNSIDGVPYGVSHGFDLDKQVTLPANAESAHLRTVISGWGHATPEDAGGRGCAEWCFRTHDVMINGSSMFQHNLGPIGCASNPVSDQAPGNWQPDRAGWCPGMAVPTRIDNLDSSMAGSTFSFEYDFEDWTNNEMNGSAYYATSTYIVVKSNSDITAPTVAD